MDAGQLYRKYQLKTVTGELKPEDPFPCRDEFVRDNGGEDGPAGLVWDSLVQMEAITCPGESHPHRVVYTPWDA
ncbi:hypothetical protein [Kitasatospora sp. NPDC057198]|uniref:hypothetical protein n=1 Tax=Kitasatospora sp. NPDC057198 TaxID=3346046 RepID=UPI00363B353F